MRRGTQVNRNDAWFHFCGNASLYKSGEMTLNQRVLHILRHYCRLSKSYIYWQKIAEFVLWVKWKILRLEICYTVLFILYMKSLSFSPPGRDLDYKRPDLTGWIIPLSLWWLSWWSASLFIYWGQMMLLATTRFRSGFLLSVHAFLFYASYYVVHLP